MRGDTSAFDRLGARERWAQVTLLITLAVAACDVGISMLAQVTITSWLHVGSAEMQAVHRHWEGAVHQIIFPLSFLTTACVIATLVLRHPHVPRWLLWPSAAVQLAIIVSTELTWARWQHRLGDMGYVRAADGTLNPFYEHILATHWVRIALVFVYCFMVLAMTLIVALRRGAAITETAEPAVAAV